MTPLWTPSPARREAAAMTHFANRYQPQTATDLAGYTALHRWSTEEPAAFWEACWDWLELRGERRGPAHGELVLPGARFFPESRLNFAENLIERGPDADIVILFRGEDGVKSALDRGSLRARVHALAARLLALGIEPGDRIAAMLPNRPETVVAMLAATSIGAVWSSCSPDFGVEGIVDRFGQIGPRLLLGCSDYRYGGKLFDCRDKLTALRTRLPTLDGLWVLENEYSVDGQDGLQAWDATEERPGPPPYASLPFNHPLYVLYSSGTTGAPKCILHGAGGTLIQHLKEHRLHCDIRPGDRVFYYTTCGWMMWNWLASALASGATLMLYDGSPFHPGPESLLDYAQNAECAFFGVSAKYIDALRQSGLRPREGHDLTALRSVASTGSPLAAESFAWVYDAMKADLALQSMSGGTDIVSCFVLGNPWLPVYAGEIQSPALGMATDVYLDGRPAGVGRKGDLVCTRPFPSLPLGFWNDEDQSRYRAAYFEQIPGIWHHGDYAEWTPRGGMVIHGRSDATLNPGGVRIGTAEIYRQVEAIDAVTEALAVGQRWDDDVRIVLFVVLAAGRSLDQALEQEIRRRIREGASPRHVPGKIIAVPDLPRTRSGKLAELAVRAVIQGEPVKNRNALANPEALDLFANLPQLQTA